MSCDPHAEAVAQAVAIHLRELPSVALDALADLVVSSGPKALVAAINEEISARQPQHFRS